MADVSNEPIIFAPEVVINELKVLDDLVDELNERAEVVDTSAARVRAIASDGRNMYEIERDEYHEFETWFLKSGLVGILGDAGYIVLDYIAPYAVVNHPYTEEIHVGRGIKKILDNRIPSAAADIVEAFVCTPILLSEPIPCAITTIGKIHDFNYDQEELINAITARGDAGLVDKHILAAANTKGVWIQTGIVDPRSKAKSKQGRPAKTTGYRLFGTSQTTFWVKTDHRSLDKVFAVKVFQKNVNFETLGGLWADCRDTRDVNEIVLAEIKSSLARPDLLLSEFSASMRNYRFRILTGQHIHLLKLYDIFREMRATTHPNVFCELDVARYPSSIIEIDVENHTSKKKRITLKVFQSGKINLDSCVFAEHVYTWYRFINQFFVDHPEVLYYPAEKDEYDSDYYYAEEGVEPPPRELVDC